MIISILQVAIAGAIGAVARFLFGTGILALTHGGKLAGGFPLPILTVNIIGSFLMGSFVVYAGHRDLMHLQPLVMTGFLGGFTTFSAFSLEAVTLMERGAMGQAGLYVGLSVGGSILGLMLGLALMRTVLG